MKRRYLAYAITILLLAACKKEDDDNRQLITPPTVAKLSRQTVQSGMEITVYGSGLVQQDRTTELFISGNPASIVKQSPDSITAIVPDNVRSGKLMLTVSMGTQFSTVYGPEVTVQPTPKIKGFAPVYAFGGQTVTLFTENFSEDAASNHFSINGLPIHVTERKGKDTFVVTIPDIASTAAIVYDTYGGPSHSTANPFQVRKRDYGVSTVAEWLQNDPAFSYMNALVTGYPELAGGNYADVYKRIYDSVLQYIQSPDKQYTIFLCSDQYYARERISKETYLQGVTARPYDYNTRLIAGVVPGYNIKVDKVKEEDAFNTAYSMLMHWYPQGTDDRNYVKLVISGSDRYAQIYGMYFESRPPVKVLNEIKVGNATIIETDGELGYVTF